MPRAVRTTLSFRGLVVGLVAMASAASGQGVPFGDGPDRDAPVEVSAESLSIDRETGVAVFSGDVVVGQGPLRLAAQRVEVEYGENRRIVSLAATGGVTLSSGEDAAEAERATYAVDEGEIVMTGDVLLTQGEGTGGASLAADRLRVELATGRAELEGRVRTILPVGD